MGLFGFNLLRAFCASCILIFVCFRFGRFSAIFLQIYFQSPPPFFFFSFGIPIMCRLACFTLSHRPLTLLSFFFFFFYLAFCLVFCFGDFHYFVSSSLNCSSASFILFISFSVFFFIPVIVFFNSVL